MYRFLIAPKWLLFHLVIAATMVAMVALGFWQLRRLDERREFNSTVEARSAQPVAPLDELAPAGSAPDTDAIEFLPVQFSGTYVPGLAYELTIRRDDMAGRDLYAIMQLDDGTVVIVDRGWLPAGTPSPALPEGEVQLTARLREPDTGGTGQLGPTGSEPVSIFRVDVTAMAADAGAAPRPMYVERLLADPAEPAEVVVIPFPDLGEGSHLGYAVQWFLFTICVFAGWAFAVARRVGELKHPEKAAALDPDTPVF